MSNKEKQTKDILAVGIDVAKASMSICLKFREGFSKALKFSNTETGIKKLAKQLVGYQGKIVMESTGHYHWLIALILSKNNLDVRVINPLLAKKYTQSCIRKVKTDKADAKVLANVALLEEHLPKPFCMTGDELVLRKKLACIGSLSHTLQSMQAIIDSFTEAKDNLKSPLTENERQLLEAVTNIEKKINKMENEVVREVKGNKEQSENIKNLVSIPGVSVFAATLATHFFSADYPSAKSWIGYAGLDVSSRESGTWKGQCKLTKRGNNFLRRRLYNAAWGATMNNNDFRAYYDYLREQENRNHVEALVIIARKIVRIMYVVISQKTTFDPSRTFYATAN
ncbi:MAG: IS110 family transposase [bacterium]|nr:IS110 family transposase [bacterium]